MIIRLDRLCICEEMINVKNLVSKLGQYFIRKMIEFWI